MVGHSSHQWSVDNARKDQAEEIVSLWRQSFQRSMGLVEQNEPVEFEHQLAFYRTISPSRVSVALPHDSQQIVGFLVQNGDMIEHLYVHVAYQRLGLGKYLLSLAQAVSPSGLKLYTFAANLNAQRFYLSQGFVEVGRGVASLAENPWASSEAQLADIEYNWPVNLFNG